MTHLIPTIHPAYLLRNPRPIVTEIISDLRKAKRISQSDPVQIENFVIAHPANPCGLEVAVRAAIGWMERWQVLRCPVAVDVETSRLDFFRCKLYSNAFSGEDGYNTAVAFTMPDLPTLPRDAQAALIEAERKLLADPNVTKIFHNAPFDLAVLSHKNYCILGPIEDTQGYAHLIQPDSHKDLGWIGHTYLDVEPWKLNHEGKKKVQTKDVLELLLYNAKDALNTMKLRLPMRREIESLGMNTTLMSYQNAYARLATRMELVGLPINFEKRKAMGDALLGQLDTLLHTMREFLHWPDFNPMSKAHAVVALYDKKYMGLVPEAFTKKTKQPSTKYEDIIDHIEHPFIRSFIEFVENRHVYATQYRDKIIASDDEEGSEAGAYARAIQDDGRLHPKWNCTGTNSPRWSSEPNCGSADTDVLTEFGWLPFPKAAELKARPFQFDLETHQASLAPVAQYVVSSSKNWVHIKTKAIDHLSTSNHRMLVEFSIQRDYKLVRTSMVLPASDLKQRFLKAGALYSRASGFIGGKEINPAWITVLCACQADGCCIHRGPGAWVFSFTKQRKISRLNAALQSCGQDAIWHSSLSNHKARNPFNHKERKQQTIFYLKPCALKSWVDSLLGPDKTFGPQLFSWSAQSLRLFVDELSQWDGRADRRSEYSTTVKNNTDFAQAAAVLSGAQMGSISEFWGPISTKPCYQISHGWKKPILGFSRKHVQNITYLEPRPAYCVTVPTGFIFVRRNGKACITGNCQNQRLADREFFEAPPGRIFVASDKSQLELRLAACLAGVPELLNEMAKPDADPHTLAAIVVYGDKFLSRNKEERKKLRDSVKTTVYAGIYKGSVKTIHKSIRRKKFLAPSLRAAMTMPVVQHIYNAYFGKFPQIFDFHDANYRKACNEGFNEAPLLGRRRYFPVQPPPYNEICNWEIQCLPASSLIATDSGLIKISNLISTNPILTPRGEQTCGVLMKMGSAPLLKLTMEDSGGDVFASPDHRYLVQDENAWFYKRAFELRPGELLCTPLPSLHDANFRESIPKDIYYWLGAIISDGSFSNYQYNLLFGTKKHFRDESQVADFIAFADARGWEPQVARKLSEALSVVILGSRRACPARTRIKQDLIHLGYHLDWICHTKRIPSSVWNGGRAAARSFLKGILDGDGGQIKRRTSTGKNAPIAYGVHSPNLRLLQDLHALCLYTGIEAVIHGPHGDIHPAYNLSMHSYDVECQLFPNRHVKRARARIAQRSHVPRDAIATFLKNIPASSFSRTGSLRTLHHKLRMGGCMNAHTLRSMYLFVGAEPPPLYYTRKLLHIADAARKEDVYTVVTSHRDHQYISDGLVSANCLGAEYVTMEMVHIQDELDRRYHGSANTVLHGHDQVVIECNERDAEDIKVIVNAMFGASRVEGPAGPVILTADAKIGKNLKAVK